MKRGRRNGNEAERKRKRRNAADESGRPKWQRHLPSVKCHFWHPWSLSRWHFSILRRGVALLRDDYTGDYADEQVGCGFGGEWVKGCGASRPQKAFGGCKPIKGEPSVLRVTHSVSSSWSWLPLAVVSWFMAAIHMHVSSPHHTILQITQRQREEGPLNTPYFTKFLVKYIPISRSMQVL